MKCKKCNCEIDNDLKFCPFCGEEQDEVVVINESQEEQNEDLAKYANFGRLSILFGILSLTVGLLLCGTPLSILAIVFGNLGKKNPDTVKKGNTAIVLGILGLVLQFIVFIIIFVLSANNQDPVQSSFDSGFNL